MRFALILRPRKSSKCNIGIGVTLANSWKIVGVVQSVHTSAIKDIKLFTLKRATSSVIAETQGVVNALIHLKIQEETQ